MPNFAWESKDSAVSKHIAQCEKYQHLERQTCNILENNGMEIRKSIIRENTRILAKAENSFLLNFLESLFIEKHQSDLNVGVKAAKNLMLF